MRGPSDRISASMKQRITKELYAYWRRVKAARLAPERNDIDLTEIRHLLPYAFIAQVDPQRRYPLKMCGTRLNAYWLEEQNGRSFLELWATHDRDAIASALATVLDEVAPVVLGARGDAEDLMPLELELLLLPLRHFGKTHSLVLGAFAPVVDHPAWLGRLAVRALRIASLRVIGRQEAVALPPTHMTRRPIALVETHANRPRLALYEGGKASDLRPQ